jgi:hypothetical protein
MIKGSLHRAMMRTATMLVYIPYERGPDGSERKYWEISNDAKRKLEWNEN